MNKNYQMLMLIYLCLIYFIHFILWKLYLLTFIYWFFFSITFLPYLTIYTQITRNSQILQRLERLEETCREFYYSRVCIVDRVLLSLKFYGRYTYWDGNIFSNLMIFVWSGALHVGKAKKLSSIPNGHCKRVLKFRSTQWPFFLFI